MIALMMVMLFQTVKQPKSSSVSVSYSDFLNMIESGSIAQVTIQGDSISGMSVRGPFKTFVPKDPDLINLLRSKGVRISAKPAGDSSLFHMFLSWAPMLLLIGVWLFFMRRMQGGGGNPLSLGKSKARLMSDAQAKVTFDDVAGAEQAKLELQKVIFEKSLVKAEEIIKNKFTGEDQDRIVDDYLKKVVAG